MLFMLLVLPVQPGRPSAVLYPNDTPVPFRDDLIRNNTSQLPENKPLPF
jgi:hypothetical protein